MTRRPGGELAARQLHFFWIVDCSGSMGADGKIQALNTAIDEAIPHMREVARQNPNAQVLVRVIKWSSTAVVQSASSPASQVAGELDPKVNVPIPEPPPIPAAAASVQDVW